MYNAMQKKKTMIRYEPYYSDVKIKAIKKRSWQTVFESEWNGNGNGKWNVLNDEILNII